MIVKDGNKMVDYTPMWEYMEKKGITSYSLINKYGFNPRTIYNLKHNKGITVYTLEKLCTILECTPNDILRFTDDDYTQ